MQNQSKPLTLNYELSLFRNHLFLDLALPEYLNYCVASAVTRSTNSGCRKNSLKMLQISIFLGCVDHILGSFLVLFSFLLSVCLSLALMYSEQPCFLQYSLQLECSHFSFAKINPQNWGPLYARYSLDSLPLLCSPPLLCPASPRD